MPYTDETYFLTKVKQSELDNLTSDDDGVPDATRLTKAIESADSLIDSYLQSVVVTLPLDPVPETIKQISYFIASYFLYDNIAFDDIPERVNTNYKNSISYLKDIQAGKVTIENLPEENANTQVVYYVDENRIDRNSF